MLRYRRYAIVEIKDVPGRPAFAGRWRRAAALTDPLSGQLFAQLPVPRARCTDQRALSLEGEAKRVFFLDRQRQSR